MTNIDPSASEPAYELFYRRPDLEPGVSSEVNVALVMGAMASRLTQEKRTHVSHPDGRAENVAEHALMLVKVAVYIAKEFYPGRLDPGVVAIDAMNHDDVEAYVLDTATDKITDELRRAKDLREAFGLSVLSQEHADIVPSYAKDVEIYEAQSTLEAEFVKVIDKWMVLLIHIPNNGAELRANYTYEEYIDRTHKEEARLLAAHPHFPELIRGRTELALHLGARFYE